MKSKLLFGGLASLSLTLAACTGGGVNTGVTSVAFAAGGATSVQVGQSVTWNATVNTAAGSTAAKTVNCSSDKPAIATAVANAAKTGCTITGVAVGSAQITATSTVDATKKATATIQVVAATSAAATRINAGGTAVGTGATAWAADTGLAANWACFTDTADTTSNGTGIADNPDPGDAITGAGTGVFAPEDVYQSNRYCPVGGANPQGSVMEFTSGTLEAGTYTVRLHFAETYHTTPGARVIDTIAINDVIQDAGADLDVFATAGADTAYAKTYTGIVLAAAGTMNVQIVASAGDPFISGIEFIKQ